KENNVSAVIRATLNAGFLSDKERFNYGGTITEEMQEKKDNMQKIANNHDVDLRSAALQFSYAPSAVTSVVVGASQPKQMIENVISMNTHIPNDFWKVLKEEQLIAQSAPEPKNDSSALFTKHSDCRRNHLHNIVCTVRNRSPCCKTTAPVSCFRLGEPCLTPFHNCVMYN